MNDIKCLAEGRSINGVPGSIPGGSTIRAKDIHIAPIKAADANRVVRRLHYSGKVVPNSQIHLGVFLRGRLEGAIQFGPSINKKGTRKLVQNTGWNDFIEINRLAFSERLPRNSESRAISVSIKIIKKEYPHIKWIVSFADGTQCGDGAIYRASGFVLTDIRANSTLSTDPATGEPMHKIQAHHLMKSKEFRSWEPLKGFQFRYIYFIDLEAKKNLTCEEIPFSKIDEMGAGMYLGKARGKQAMGSFQEPQRQGSADLHAP